jgi:hypothetical protein
MPPAIGPAWDEDEDAPCGGEDGDGEVDPEAELADVEVCAGLGFAVESGDVLALWLLKAAVASKTPLGCG